MQPPKESEGLKICQNCATEYVAPSGSEKDYTLVYENERFYWKPSDGSEKIPIKQCCDFPYIEEYQFS